MPSPTPYDNLADIRRQLDEAHWQFNALEMRPRESLRDFEYRVKRHSDKILSLKVAEQVQQQQIEQEAREAEELLKKRVPGYLFSGRERQCGSDGGQLFVEAFDGGSDELCRGKARQITDWQWRD